MGKKNITPFKRGLSHSTYEATYRNKIKLFTCLFKERNILPGSGFEPGSQGLHIGRTLIWVQILVQS